jgi:hypothetical protein
MTWFADVGGFFTNVGNTVNDNVFKPIGTAVIAVGNAGLSVVNKVAGAGGRILDAGVSTVEHGAGAINGIADIFANPIFIVGGLIITAIVLNKVLK